MTPADPFSSELREPTEPRVDATDRRKRPRRGGHSAPDRPAAAEKHRPDDRSSIVLRAYLEYQSLRQQGQTLDIQEWCDRYPTCRSALHELLQIEGLTGSYLDRHSPESDNVSMDWPCAGEQRGDFTILRELARGGLARVYLATEASTGGRLVVLKCSALGDIEARTQGPLAHPNIVPILSARLDEMSGLTLVCMPYLGSVTLEDVLDHRATVGALPSKGAFFREVLHSHAQPEDPPLAADSRLFQGSYNDGVIQLAAQLAETLAFLHQNGVSHRDLKPANVLLDFSGKPLLLDFNLAQSDCEAIVPIGGTLRYMAPEQLRALLDERRDGMDARVDFYALGVMVYELLGGVHPYAALLEESSTPVQAQSMLANLNAGFRPFREICPELERPVAAVLDRCVAFDASRRPSSAAELAAALRLQFTPARRLRRRLVSHRRWMLTTLAFFLTAVSIFAYAWAVTPPYCQREYDLGRIAYFAGDFDAAEMHFDRALRAEPNDAIFCYARGCARLQQSKYQLPNATTFDNILDDLTFTERGATDPRTLAVHAYADQRRQRHDQAITKYGQILQSNYRPVMVLNNRAYSYLCKGRMREAQDHLEKAVQIEPHPPQAVHYNRAILALKMRWQRKAQNIPPQALRDMEEALHSGTTTSTLFRHAALLYGLAADDDPRSSYLDHALGYLREALLRGEPPAQFQAVSSLAATLKRPEFVALLPAQPAYVSAQPDLRLIDPVDLPD